MIACVWYMIGNADDGWVPSVFPLGTETVVERYFQSMSTVALGSFIEETKPNEEVFAIFSVLFNGFVRALKPNLFRVTSKRWRLWGVYILHSKRKCGAPIGSRLSRV